MHARRAGKSYALDIALSARTGTSHAQIRRMREEGGTFTLANGERVLFVSPDTLRRPAGYDAFVRSLARLMSCLALALSLAISAHASPPDDCDGVMAALAAARQSVEFSIDAVNSLEAAIAAPTWDPVGDGWMIPALDGALADLIGDLNAAALAEEAAHAAHCY